MDGIGRWATKLKFLSIPAILPLILVIGVAQDEDLTIENVTESRFAFNLAEVVRGIGFHNINQDFNFLTGEPENRYNGLHFKNSGHGSGSYDYEESLIANKGARFSQIGGESVATGNFGIEFNESEDHVYSSTYFYSGKNFKFDGFQSKGRSKTLLANYLRNRGGGATLDAFFDNAEVMSKDVSASLYHTTETHGTTDENRTYRFIGVARLELDAAFTGNLHIGGLTVGDERYRFLGSALQLQGNPAIGSMLFDEDYSGTYSITSKLYYEFIYGSGINSEENWLPCCYGGWGTMPRIYQTYFGNDSKAIFDCTCSKKQIY
ncbi:MAG: hypothetical protein MUO26_01795 [Methanotrichaceae archaeon]|nr:hypothetical protein [Methanotrichaceae archaeon]